DARRECPTEQDEHASDEAGADDQSRQQDDPALERRSCKHLHLRWDGARLRASTRGELQLRQRLRRRVPRLPVLLRDDGFRGPRRRRRREARRGRDADARRGRDERPGRSRRAGCDRRAGVAARALPDAELGAGVPRRRRVARLLVAQADLPRRLARPSGEARRTRGRLGRARGRVRVPAPRRRRTAAARARAGAVVARAAVPPVATAAGAAYLATLLALDHFASYPQQLALGAVTWLVLGFALARVAPERRAQALGVVVFATLGEVTGSLVWGVYRYRLHNLPLFVPPAHGLVYLTGLSLAASLRRHTRALVATAAALAAGWGLLGLTVLPRRDVAGAFGVPLLLVFLWRGRNRAVYAGVFLVVAALELYGTAIGTWRWAHDLPGLGIPDGNPPSGVASGYVWFDVMALLVAPYLVVLTRRPRRETDDLRTPAQSH